MKIALIGYGKMGKMIETAALDRGHTITGVIDPFSSDVIPGAVKLRSIPPTAAEAGDPDLFIEFTRPETAPDNILAAAALRKPLVCGTTGWYKKLADVSAAVERAGTALLWSSNFSLGVNLFFRMAVYAARLADPFAEYDLGGLEIHHRKKLDSPSGTAKALMERVLAAVKRKTKVLWDVSNDAVSGDTVHFASLRHGSVPGIHSLFFDSPADTIEITHTARNREGFASGAMVAAEWLAGFEGEKRRGIFTMDDVLKDLLPKEV
ncbi:MAG: 4-hydroxy-tetrahydrodipicolinate reductase [Treponema sp.]|jgi:4-hydroxy-tetrahydrodipicolinate reductase|nr:4-hydroxy-tetrahydrodipicolinate reductase [Treponema sp.]